MFTAALIFSGSGRTPSLPNLCPRKVNSDFLHTHLARFSFRPESLEGV